MAFGSQSSVARTVSPPARSMNLLPPVTATTPVGRTVALAQARPKFIGAASVRTGLLPLMSTIVARLLERNPLPLS